MAEKQELEDRIRILEQDLLKSQREVIAYKQKLAPPLRHAEENSSDCCAQLERTDYANNLRRGFMEKSGYKVRTSLNSVFSALDVLEESCSEEHQEYVSMAIEETLRLHGIIRDVFDFFRLEVTEITLQSVDFDLRKSLDNELADLSFDAHNRGIEFSCDIANDVPLHLRGDSRRLGQVILGIVGNRLRHTQDDGAVALNVTNDGHLPDGRALIRFAVTDIGAELPRELVQEIRNFVRQEAIPGRFEPLAAGKASLDLVCALQLLKIFQANIAVSSDEYGNIFCFSLPFGIAGKEPSAEVKKQEPCSVLRGKKVLVVEDDFINRVLVTKLLEQQGITVVTAEDGRKGLEKLETEDFDLILMDIQMPVLDGFEASRAIRAREKGGEKRSTIIALTAIADREKCLQAGMDDYLAKPLDKNVFINTLTEHLTRSALIIHDDMETVQSIMGTLLHKGWRVTTAETSRQGLYEAALGGFDAFFVNSSLSSSNGMGVPHLIRQLENYVGRKPVIIGLGEVEKSDSQVFDKTIAPPCTPQIVEEQIAFYFEGGKSSN